MIETVKHPPGFRRRRGLNWAFVGLLYTSFYMCRYNFSLANKEISREFGFSKAQMGNIITTALLAYACGQIINGLLTDRLGGKRAMLIGTAGTVIMNLLFGIASFWGLLWLFVVIRGIDGYLQAFGSPGMVKINAAWFRHNERGRFAGIFGFMINLGRFGIFKLGPALLAGFVFLGLIRIPPLHWRWLFWIPAGIALVVGTCMALIVKDTPEEVNFPPVNPDEETGGRVQVKVLDVFKIIVTNPGGLDHCLRLRMHGRRAPRHRSMVPSLHAGSAPCRFSICAISISGLFDSIRRFGRIATLRLCFRHNLWRPPSPGCSRPLFSGNRHHSFRGAIS